MSRALDVVVTYADGRSARFTLHCGSAAEAASYLERRRSEAGVVSVNATRATW